MAATLAVLFAAAAAAAEPAQRLHLRYHGYLGAAPVLEMSVDLTLLPDAAAPRRYRAEVAVDPSAALGELVPFRLTAQAGGSATPSPGPERLRPERYASLATLGSAYERVDLTYGPDGAVAVRRDPPGGSAEPPAAAEGGRTLDPLSAAVASILAAARGGACAGRFPVFDGVRRYDLSLAPVGPAELAPSRWSLYTGPARECTLTVAFREGFRAADLRSGLYPESVRVWFAPAVEGAPDLPVRFAARSALGAMQLDLVEAGPAPATPPS